MCIWARDNGMLVCFTGAGVLVWRFMRSFFSANATCLSSMESSLSTDSAVETVSMYAMALTFSLPFRVVYSGCTLRAVLSALVDG
jgi:hypothetical protein